MSHNFGCFENEAGAAVLSIILVMAASTSLSHVLGHIKFLFAEWHIDGRKSQFLNYQS